MSKAREPALRQFAAQSLAERVGAVRGYVQAVRDAQDQEAVHQMRVASRRLRAALNVFAPAMPPKKLKRWRKQVRAITAALGDARDIDVQVAFIDARLDALDADHRAARPGLQRLHLRLTQQRRRAQDAVVAAMDGLENADLFAAMPDELHRIAVETRESLGAGAAQLLGHPAIRRHGRQAITQRLDQMLGYEAYVDQPAMVEQLHQMRIEAKRLRYTVELFQPAFGDQLDKPLKRIRKVQAALGDVHDLDVWLAFLPRFLDEERRRTADYFGHTRSFKRLEAGILDLINQLQDERRLAFESFGQRWHKLVEAGTWRRLRRLLREPTIEAASPAAASPLDPPAGPPEPDATPPAAADPAPAPPDVQVNPDAVRQIFTRN